jgi:hypothetical protein
MQYVIRSPHPRGGGVFAYGNTLDKALRTFLNEAYTGLSQIQAKHVRVCTVDHEEFEVCPVSGSLNSAGEITVLPTYTDEEWYDLVKGVMYDYFDKFQELSQIEGFFNPSDKVLEHCEELETWIRKQKHEPTVVVTPA